MQNIFYYWPEFAGRWYQVYLEISAHWTKQLAAWWNRRPQREVLLERLSTAVVYEEWDEIARQLDTVLRLDAW